MIKVMFLCTGNSCRSQMAEGFARHYGKGLLDVYSAGLFPAGVNPYAIRVMAEAGIDISLQSSKAIVQGLLDGMDLIVTLCDYAESMCPATPIRIKRLHWPIVDPVGTEGPDDEIMREFRRARNEIEEKVKALIDSLRGPYK
jgi:arsenate reductase